MIDYRPEIDGLRALAVIPVILFHAGFSIFGGGFIGVDIFFVISGYLITAIIVSEAEGGTFSVAGFYERRARRILPALFLVMVCCLPLVWMWMTPQQAKRFFHSLVATSLFSSNILFWYTSGYFDTAAEEKPLLHTWSLGVEEQFYLLFPLLLVVLKKVRPGLTGYVVLFLAILSFGLSEILARNGSSTANFFLTPTRVWELLIGALIVFASRRETGIPALSLWQKNAISCAGLGLIMFSLFAYDKTTPFPSAYALAPTLGTAMILMFGDGHTFVAKLLSSSCMVFIGLISYSAYLWHQPLLAFLRIYSLSKPPQFLFGVVSVVSIGLACLTWYFVERPFRDRRRVSRRVIIGVAAIGTMLFSGIGLAGHLTKGFELMYLERLSIEQSAVLKRLEEATSTSGYAGMFDNGECRFWSETITREFVARYDKCTEEYGKAVIVLGDSHAMDLYNSLAMSSTADFLVGVSGGGL